VTVASDDAAEAAMLALYSDIDMGITRSTLLAENDVLLHLGFGRRTAGVDGLASGGGNCEKDESVYELAMYDCESSPAWSASDNRRWC